MYMYTRPNINIRDTDSIGTTSNHAMEQIVSNIVPMESVSLCLLGTSVYI